VNAVSLSGGGARGPVVEAGHREVIPLSCIAMASLSNRGRNEASIRRFLRYGRGTNRSIPKIFRNEEKQVDLFEKIGDQRKTNHFYSSLQYRIRKKVGENVFFEGSQSRRDLTKKKDFDIVAPLCTSTL